MSDHDVISRRIREASGSGKQSSKKEILTWTVSEHVQKWINHLIASIFIVGTVLLSLFLLTIFGIAVIRGVSKVSNYPVTILSMGVILFVAWARWVRGSIFLKPAVCE